MAGGIGLRTYSETMVLSLTSDGELYGMFDENGRQIGSGSREVCQTLRYMRLWGSETPRPARRRVNSCVGRPQKREPAKAD